MKTIGTKTKRQIIIGFLVVAILALLFGMWVQYNLTTKKKEVMATLNLTSATLLPQPKTLNPFQLTADNNKPFTNDNFKGHWSLLFFGFTNCPELCPTTLTTLKQTYANLQAMQTTQMPQVIFISVDPERDTSKRIADYLSSFNKAFIGATGSQQQINQLTEELNVVYMKVIPQTDEEETYSIDHSGTILMINPKGQLYAIFTTPHDAKAIANDVNIIINQHS